MSTRVALKVPLHCFRAFRPRGRIHILPHIILSHLLFLSAHPSYLFPRYKAANRALALANTRSAIPVLHALSILDKVKRGFGSMRARRERTL